MISALFILTNIPIVFSQSSSTDSIKRAVKRDIVNFKPDREKIKEVKNGLLKSTSDFFRPTEVTSSNLKLLKDSQYVSLYRTAAYKKTQKAKTPVQKVVKGIEIALIAFLALFFVAMNAASK